MKFLKDNWDKIAIVFVVASSCIILTMLFISALSKVSYSQRNRRPNLQEDSTIVSKSSAGKILSVKRYSHHTEITTDSMSIVIRGYPLIIIGIESEIVKDQEGKSWFTWRDCPKRYKIDMR